jgi:hypothetical protein
LSLGFNSFKSGRSGFMNSGGVRTSRIVVQAIRLSASKLRASNGCENNDAGQQKAAWNLRPSGTGVRSGGSCGPTANARSDGRSYVVGRHCLECPRGVQHRWRRSVSASNKKLVGLMYSGHTHRAAGPPSTMSQVFPKRRSGLNRGKTMSMNWS